MTTRTSQFQRAFDIVRSASETSEGKLRKLLAHVRVSRGVYQLPDDMQLLDAEAVLATCSQLESTAHTSIARLYGLGPGSEQRRPSDLVVIGAGWDEEDMVALNFTDSETRVEYWCAPLNTWITLVDDCRSFWDSIDIRLKRWGEKKPPKCPLVLKCSRGRIKVAGFQSRFRDVQLSVNGAEPWDWTDTGTHHVPGVQVADILSVPPSPVLVVGLGTQRRLQVSAEARAHLDEKGILLVERETSRAVAIYNCYVELGVEVSALIHSRS